MKPRIVPPRKAFFKAGLIPAGTQLGYQYYVYIIPLMANKPPVRQPATIGFI